MERRGSGLKKIRDEYRKAYEYSKDYAPEFCSTRTDFTTILKNLNYRYKKSDSETHLSENVGINVGITEGRVIELIRNDEHITTKAISENLGITIRQVEKIISNLRKSEIIERLGSNKTG